MGKKDKQISEVMGTIRALKKAQNGMDDPRALEVLQRGEIKALSELFDLLDRDRPKAEASQQRKEPQTTRTTK